MNTVDYPTMALRDANRARQRREQAARLRLETMHQRYGAVSGNIKIRMFVSDWFICAADGLATRIIRQVER